LTDEFLYWFCAHYFKFTPEQVDNTPADRIAYMIVLEKEAHKKEFER